MTEQTRKHPPFGRGEVWSLAADRSAWPLGSDDDGVVTWIDSKPRPGGAANRRGPLGRVGLPDGGGRLGVDAEADRAGGVRRADALTAGAGAPRPSASRTIGRLPTAPHRVSGTGFRGSSVRLATVAPSAGTWLAVSTIPRVAANRATGSMASRTSPPRSASTPTSAASPSPGGVGSSSRLRPSAAPMRTSACSASAIDSPSAASPAHWKGIEIASGLGVMEHHDALW